jgi:hypothetical protein
MELAEGKSLVQRDTYSFFTGGKVNSSHKGNFRAAQFDKFFCAGFVGHKKGNSILTKDSIFLPSFFWLTNPALCRVTGFVRKRRGKKEAFY